MIVLDYKVTQEPDFGGFRFYVECGKTFSPIDYAYAYSLNYYEIDPDSVKMIKDAVCKLEPGEWLEVTHD